MKKVLLILLTILSLNIQGQDYYYRTFQDVEPVTTQSYIANTEDDGVIQATKLDSKKILVRRVNKCGEEIWAKHIKHPTEELDIVDCKIDSNRNFVFSGNLGPVGSNASPFILSMSENGIVNYFKKVVTSSSIETITYSFAVNKQGHFFLYFNYNTGVVGNGARISVLKMDIQGNLLWFKSYQGVANWGRAIATSDGGLFFRSGASYTKVDQAGNVEWSNFYQNLGYIGYPVEIENGFVMFRFPSGSGTTNVLMLNKSGVVQWMTNNITNLSPRNSRGILRKNGNVLFTGNAQGVGILEIDTANGDIKTFEQIDPNNSFAMLGVDLFENDSGEVFISGLDASTIFSRNFYMRLDDSLKLSNCASIPLQISSSQSPIPNAIPNTVTTINQSGQLLSIVNEPFIDSSIQNTPSIVSCEFQFNRGVNEVGRDTILCPKSSITLGNNNNNFDQYRWSTGATSKTINISQAGIYWLETIAACDTIRDTVNISYYPMIGLDLGSDTTLCEGDSLVLGNGLNFNNYTWSTGDTTPTLTVYDKGVYWLEIQTNCGAVRDSITIGLIPSGPPLNLGNDTIACPVDSIVLGDTNSNYLSYQWNTGATTKTISVLNSGWYILEVTSQCRTYIDSIAVGIYSNDFTPFVLSDIEVFTQEEFFVLDTNSSSFSSSWNFGDRVVKTGDSISYRYEFPGVYTIRLNTLTPDGCPYTTTKTIIVKSSPYTIPTVFTPNNDGINDRFAPYGNDILSFEIKIFNRWGNLIKKTNSEWDGRIKNGKRSDEGTYFYEITLYFKNGKQSKEKGEIVLLR